MKYQIILDGDKAIADDDFKRAIELVFNRIGLINNPCQFDAQTLKFNLVEARSLEGIREEVWKYRDNLIQEVFARESDIQEDNQNAIQKTFDDLSDLLGIGD